MKTNMFKLIEHELREYRALLVFLNDAIQKVDLGSSDTSSFYNDVVSYLSNLVSRSKKG